MINLQNVKVKNGSAWNTICPFPVGFVYSSYTNTSPGSTFGGTWTPITGRFPYYNNGTGAGGANSHAHNHGLYGCFTSHLNNIYWRYTDSSISWNNNYNVGVTSNGTSSGAEKDGMVIGGTISTASNMPAYQTLYAWRRTA